MPPSSPESSRPNRSLSGLALAAVWLAVAGLLLALQAGLPAAVGWQDVDYDAFGESTEALAQHLLVSEAALAVGLCVLITWLRWWRPVLIERRRVSRWYLIVPVVLIPLSLVSVDWARLSDLGPGYAGALALTTALIGFNEELFARGVLLVGVRRLAPEWQAWLLSSIAFGTLHLVNLALGAPAGGVVAQVVFLTFGSTTYYLARRASGTIVVPMLMHALWDFALFSQAPGEAGDAAPTELLTLASGLLLLGCLATVPIWLRGGPPRPKRSPGA